MIFLALMLLAQTELAVVGYRPLALAVEELERRHGWNISYEEARWPAEAPQGRIRFRYDPAHGAERVLRALVEAHASQGNAGRFDVVAVAPRKWVVVIRARDSWPVASPLEFKVSIDAAMRPVVQSEQLLSRQLSSAAGHLVSLSGGGGPNFWVRQRTRVSASLEPARQVLERTLRTLETDPDWATPRTEWLWHLYCDGRVCAVNYRPRHGAKVDYPPGYPLPPPQPPPR